MKKINIAIDGPSGVGKSSAAKAIANELELVFINTGLMYRAIGYYSLINNIDLNSLNSFDAILKNINLELLPNERIKLNDEDVTSKLYDDKISLLASQVAKNSEVRKYCVEIQQVLAKSKPGVVMEGRDIGSVVLPNADLKIFLTASEEIRAKRRFDQLKQKNNNINEEEILKNIIERDKQDISRENAPLVKMPDAIEIDTTKVTLEEVIQNIISLAKDKMK